MIDFCAICWEFGTAVAISGDWVLVGAKHDESTYGSAYFFYYSSGSWIQWQKVVNHDALDNWATTCKARATAAYIGCANPTNQIV